MKNLKMIIIIALLTLEITPCLWSQTKALFTKSEDLYIINLKDGESVKIPTNINIFKLRIVDTNLYFKGYTGKKKLGMHHTYIVKVWRTSLPSLLKNKYIDSLEELDTNVVTALPLFFTPFYSILEDTNANYLYKFNTGKGIDSINISKDILNLRKQYKDSEPIIQVRNISEIHKNKCLVNAWVFTKRKDATPEYTHDTHGFLFLYDLKRKKQIKSFSIMFGELENITLIE